MGWKGKFARLFIGGDWVGPSSQSQIEVISPATEQRVATVASASAPDVERAVAAARVAVDSGPWPRMPSSERLGVLRRFLSLYVENEETVASIVTEEMGCPISLSRTFQAATPRLILESYLELAETYPFRSVRRGGTRAPVVTRAPSTPAAPVGPSNVPASTS